METVLEVKNLTKNYRKLTAVNNISFTSGPSNIIGLVGPNGAGKTTLIKMILGLSHPSSGEIFINGYSVSKNYQKAIKRVSGIVEVPAFYPNLSGFTNLKLTANTYGITDKKYISDIVDMLGLSDRINDKVRKYSLGMKQRLGICRALINKPDLLILDEPINGLDPDGIVQFRNLMLKIKNESNCCIIISSHILAEIEKICDKTIFIMKGKEVSLESDDIDNNLVSYEIDVNSVESFRKAFQDVLKANPEFSEVSIFYPDTGSKSDKIIVKANEDKPLKKLISSLFISGLDIDGFNRVKTSLEDNYLEITRENN